LEQRRGEEEQMSSNREARKNRGIMEGPLRNGGCKAWRRLTGGPLEVRTRPGALRHGLMHLDK
jgi:hypothetical protein